MRKILPLNIFGINIRKMLSNAIITNTRLEQYCESVKKAKEDIATQISGFRQSVGDVADSYRKIIMDKLWSMNRLVGEHYLEALKGISDMETEVIQNTDLTPQTSYTAGEIKELLEECPPSEGETKSAYPPSDTVSAE